ncbi:diguanylate cyclase (GGDEF) domain-containing protein [Andreprevotia lacus DSM 23236]|jgi:diguanylate cyclase (GGDEF)-like protein|uniref:diguanylate cyclase n=2 Tax=Andreprevotia TaxID=397275 RepID=A0A1W1Y1B5_9NEIS|nr:diguanylate cyclase (GGDEF) domain-containing protein [Andreprevotia lacus DSM 23236]
MAVTPTLPMKTATPAPFSDIERLIDEAQASYAPRCEQTLVLAQQAVELARKAAYAEGEARALLWWAKSAFVLSGWRDAKPLVTRALKLAPEQTAGALRAQLQHVVAQCHVAAGHPALALQSWLQCLNGALQTESVATVVEACLGIGDLYVVHDDRQQAFYYHSLAHEFAQLLGDDDLCAKSSLFLASDLIKLKRLDIAKSVLLGTEQHLILPLRRDWLAEMCNYLGLIYSESGEFELARRYLDRAYEINLETGYLWDQTVTLLSLGRMTRKQGNDAEAENFLKRALDVVMRFGAANLIMQIHEELSKLYEARGDHARAVMHYIGFHDHYMQIAREGLATQATRSSARRLANLEIKLRLMSSELEVQQLRQQSQATSQQMKQLETAAYRDGLTGIYNRRTLDQRLPDLVKLAQGSGTPLAILVIDFDHFKLINDNFSHQTGDRVLQEGALLLQEGIRDADLLARYGGEEFALVLPGATLPVAVQVAERIRQRVANFDWDEIAPGLRVTVSIGCAQLRATDTIESLIALADQALYSAKRGGRNRVREAATA